MAESAQESVSLKKPEFVITVSNPEKCGEGLKSYIIYTVSTETTNEDYRYSSFQVTRRYSDFLWLHDVLSDEFKHLVIPPIPEKSTSSQFDLEFIELRRRALQTFINKVANHSVLKDSENFKLFLEAENDDLKEVEHEFKKPINMKDITENPLEAGKKLLNIMGNVLTKASGQVKDGLEKQIKGDVPQDKTSEKLADYADYLACMSNSPNLGLYPLALKKELDNMEEHSNTFIDTQRTIADSYAELYYSLQSLGSCEDHELANTITELSKVYETLAGCYQEKCNREIYLLYDPFRELACEVQEIQYTLKRRRDLVVNYNNAFRNAKSLKEKVEKAKAEGSEKLKKYKKQENRAKKLAKKMKKELNDFEDKLDKELDDCKAKRTQQMRDILLDFYNIQLYYAQVSKEQWTPMLEKLKALDMDGVLKKAVDHAQEQLDHDLTETPMTSDLEDEDEEEEEKPKKKAKKAKKAEKAEKPKKKAKKADSDDSDSDSDLSD